MNTTTTTPLPKMPGIPAVYGRLEARLLALDWLKGLSFAGHSASGWRSFSSSPA
ncbi:MAG: hypothetical protein WDN06_02175 [Asticcacaulis sp.]